MWWLKPVMGMDCPGLTLGVPGLGSSFCWSVFWLCDLIFLIFKVGMPLSTWDSRELAGPEGILGDFPHSLLCTAAEEAAGSSR